MAIGILPNGQSLACDQDGPHPGVMHYDAVRGIWWGDADDGLMILDPEISGC
jgi:hypothetical protein